MATDFDGIARAQMADQVQNAATIQVAISSLWDRMVDPRNLDATFPPFSKAALALVQAGRARGELQAQEYYYLVRELSNVNSAAVVLAASAFDLDAALTSMYATGYATTIKQQNAGTDSSIAAEAGKVAMLRAVQRLVSDAGRQRLIDYSKQDKAITAWARVSDGNPCHFCALLISRGPVYKASTVNFRAHDGCGCGARLVTKADPTRGWSSDARAFADLYKNTPGGLSEFRKAYDQAKVDPNSEIVKAITQVNDHAMTQVATAASRAVGV